MSLLLLLTGAAAGAQTVTLNALTLTGSVPSSTVTPGGVTTNLDVLTLASSVPSGTVTPGGVTTNLDTLTLMSTINDLKFDAQFVWLDTLTLAGQVIKLRVNKPRAQKKGWPFWRYF